MNLKIQIKQYYKEHKFHINIFTVLVISVVITILIISSILYINFERIILNKSYFNSMSSLSKTGEDSAIIIDTAINLTNQIYRDQNIIRLSFPSQPDVFDIQKIMAQLKSYSTIMPFIDSIYVYNKNTALIYLASNTARKGIQDKTNFDDPDIFNILSQYHSYKPFSPIPRKLELNSLHGGAGYYYTFLAYDWFNKSNELDYAVIVNISEEYFQNILQSEKENTNGETFAMDNKGIVISNSIQFPMMLDLSNKTYIQKILDSQEQGYTINEVDKVKSLIVYTAPNSLGWRYINIIPYSLIINDINRMKVKTLIIALLMLLFGLSFSIIASKKLYNPIEKIISRLGDMEVSMRNSFYTLKQEFLRSIIFERKQYDLTAIYSNFTQFKIKFNPETQYYICLLKIDNYNEYVKANSPKDRNVLKLAIMNKTAEIFSQKNNVEAVDFDDDSVCLLLNVDNEQEPIDENTFSESFIETKTAIMKNFHISVSITISTMGETINSIHCLFLKTTAASRYRIFYGHGSIIFTDKVIEYESKEYDYPLEKEKILIDSLMAGKTSEAKNQYLEIMGEINEHSVLALNLVVSRLAFTINSAISTIQKNNNIPIQEISHSFYMPEESFEIIDEIHNYFFNLFDSINEILYERKNSKHEKLINKIESIIQTKYMDSSLSLDCIADSLNLSVAHISRIYKQHKLKTILEAISEHRMNEAKELLKDTDLPITKIAEMTGFNYDSYFYIAFKKKNGVTPADYRKNYKQPTNFNTMVKGKNVTEY